MNKTIRVILIEDNPEYRGAVKLALDDEADIELISQFGTSEVALRTLEDQESEIIPDVILLDLRLPGRDGIDSIADLRVIAPQAKIIILTQSNQETDVLRAISLGASGYLLKSATLDELTQGIRTVFDGGAPLDASIAKFILNSLQKRLPGDYLDLSLSTREMEILSLLAEGMVKKEVAKRLKIGYSTVDTHVSHIYMKLGVTNAPAAVNKAHRLNIFPADTDT